MGVGVAGELWSGVEQSPGAEPSTRAQPSTWPPEAGGVDGQVQRLHVAVDLGSFQKEEMKTEKHALISNFMI